MRANVLVEHSNHPVDVGQRSETAILAAFIERGFLVWLPWGVNHRGEIDCFAVYCPENRRIFIVPCDETTRNNVSLRLEPTTNCQRKRIRWAEGLRAGTLRSVEPERGLEPLHSRLQGERSTN